jgi:hypothetical protein
LPEACHLASRRAGEVLVHVGARTCEHSVELGLPSLLPVSSRLDVLGFLASA